MAKVRWLKSAKTDLREIYDYICIDSKRYAKLQLNRIYERTKILQKQPNIGKEVSELENPEIRELTVGNYRIIYRVLDETRVDILMVHHGARDLERRFKL